MNNSIPERSRYLVVDDQYAPLAKAVLESPAREDIWQMRLLDSKPEDMAQGTTVRLVNMGDGSPALLGRILQRQGDQIVVECVERLSEDQRQNLRMPVSFDSFIYPLSDTWRGRRAIRGYDLSCGGIAFYVQEPLEVRERLEVVIPLTHPPLVVRAQILRPLPTHEPMRLYAAKFVELCEGEEKLIREAVFNVQLVRGGKTK